PICTVFWRRMPSAPGFSKALAFAAAKSIIAEASSRHWTRSPTNWNGIWTAMPSFLSPDKKAPESWRLNLENWLGSAEQARCGKDNIGDGHHPEGRDSTKAEDAKCHQQPDDGDHNSDDEDNLSWCA